MSKREPKVQPSKSVIIIWLIALVILISGIGGTLAVNALDRVVDLDIALPAGKTTISAKTVCYNKVLTMFITLHTERENYRYIRPVQVENTVTKIRKTVPCAIGAKT